MRKRKGSPLGQARPVRTIPIPIPIERPDGSRTAAPRPLVPLEPSLAALGDGLRPPATGGAPAAWASWSVPTGDDELVVGRWETPVVDGEVASGHGQGFPRPARPTGPVTIEAAGPQVPAAAAGWAPAPATPTPAPAGSWVAPVAALGAPHAPVPEPVAVGAAPAPLPSPVPGSPEVRAAIAQHPSSARPAPAAPPVPAVAPAAPAGGAVDPEDYTQRLERGCAHATTPEHVTTLADRALARLVPQGRTRWYVAHPDGSLTLRLAIGAAPVGGCAVATVQDCPALASGRARRFARSDAPDACAQLHARGGPSCAVVCVPVAGQGPLAGVVQVAAPREAPVDLVTAALVDRTARTLAARAAELRGPFDAG